MPTGCDHGPNQDAFHISQLRDSCDEESRLFMLRSSETPKWSLVPLASSSLVTTICDQGPSTRVLHNFIPSRAFSCLINGPQSPFDRRLRLSRGFAFRHFGISVMKCFDTPSHEPQNDLKVFRFHISAFRHFCDEVFRHSKSRTPK
jgi:hypothetical protein